VIHKGFLFYPSTVFEIKLQILALTKPTASAVGKEIWIVFFSPMIKIVGGVRGTSASLGDRTRWPSEAEAGFS